MLKELPWGNMAELMSQGKWSLNDLLLDDITTTPPCIEDFRELWCLWDEDLENVGSAFWAFTDRQALRQVEAILAAQGFFIDLCPADSPLEATKDLNLTLFLIDGAATVDLLGRLYTHTAAIENRYFALRQELNNLKEVVQQLVDAAASRDPALTGLQTFAKQ